MDLDLNLIVETDNPNLIPQKAHESDAGYDLVAASDAVVVPGSLDSPNLVIYKLGIKIALPEGYCGLILARSSISKRGMWLCNSIGLIDPGYRGELQARFYAFEGADLYEKGDRVAQLMLLKLSDFQVAVGLVNKTDRGEGGFGSTGI